MDTLTYVPHKATAGKMVPRVLRARFGDGYVQEMGDGINSMLRTWELVWEGLHASGVQTPDIKDLNDFFTAQAGYKKFLWVQPPPWDIESTKVFVCMEWSWVHDAGQIVGLHAMIEQRPD